MLADLLRRTTAALARWLETREEGVTIIEYVALTAIVAAIAAALYAMNIDDMIAGALRAAVEKALGG